MAACFRTPAGGAAQAQQAQQQQQQQQQQQGDDNEAHTVTAALDAERDAAFLQE